jgi:hypothetical protein
MRWESSQHGLLPGHCKNFWSSRMLPLVGIEYDRRYPITECDSLLWLIEIALYSNQGRVKNHDSPVCFSCRAYRYRYTLEFVDYGCGAIFAEQKITALLAVVV